MLTNQAECGSEHQLDCGGLSKFSFFKLVMDLNGLGAVDWGAMTGAGPRSGILLLPLMMENKTMLKGLVPQNAKAKTRSL